MIVLELDSLKSQLYKHLEATAAAVTKLARDQNVGTTNHSYEVMWMVPDKDGSKGKVEAREEFVSVELFYRLREEIESLPSMKELNQVCEIISSNYGKPFTFRFPLQPGHHGLNLLHRYLDLADGLVLQQKTIAQACDEYIDHWLSNSVVIRTVFLLRNFSASTEFKLSDEITIRKINGSDIDSYGRLNSWSSLRGQPPWLSLDDWVCDARETSSKDTMEVANRHGDLEEDIALSLGLTSPGRVELLMLDHYLDSPYFPIGHGSRWTPIYSAGHGGKVELEAEDISKLTNNFEKIKAVRQGRQASHLQFALRRLQMAASRRNQEDMIVDYVIALENLLTRDNPQLETTFRFRLRGAALLTESFGEAQERIKLMGDLYGLRSNIVHGDAKPERIQEMLSKAEDVLRAILL